ncbi:hypothetical protein LQW54_010101 [Pestalotiopsis sp. IQ-011]
MAEPMDVDDDLPIDLRQWAREQFGDAFLNGGQATDKDILSLMAFSHKRWAQARFRFFLDNQRGDPTFGSDAIPSISKAAMDIRESANAMIHQGHMVDDLINTRMLQPTYTHKFRNEPMPTADEYTRIRSTLFGISYRLTVEEAWVIVRLKNDYNYENEYATSVYPAWDLYNDLLAECVSTSQRLLKVTPRPIIGRGDDWSELSRRTINPLILQREVVINAITKTARFGDVIRKLKITPTPGSPGFPFHWSNKTFDTDNSLIPTLDQLPDLPVQRVTPWQKNDLAFGLTEWGAHTLGAAAAARGGPPLGTLGPALGDAGGPMGRSYANGVGDEGPDNAWDYRSTVLGRRIKGVYYLTSKDRETRVENIDKARRERLEAAQAQAQRGGGGNNPGPNLGNGFAGAGGPGGGNDGGNNGGNRGGRNQRPDGRGRGRGNHRNNAAAGANQNGGRGGGRQRNDDNDGTRNTRRRTGNTWNNMAGTVAGAARTRAARVADIAVDPAYSSLYGRRAAAAERGSGISWEELERRELEAQGISYDYGYDEEDYEEDEEEEEEEEDDMAQFVRLHGRPRGITRTAAAEDSLAERKRLADEIGLVSSLGKRRRI